MTTPAAPRIPDYELLRLIGRGSYGDVWLARGITGAFRAVKVVWRDRFSDARPYEREFEGITRFAAVSLREPSQLAVLHAGRAADGAWFYYVMELADDVALGRAVDPADYAPLTLRELFARRGRLPASEVIALGTTLARAVASLHAAGLVHRDIKPSNVILVGGVPKLADVGLVTSVCTGQATFVGTEGFVPPEGPGAPAADVYSLGKLLYELATGLDRNDFPRLPDGLFDWPDRRDFLELNEVLLRACERDAARRHADATALHDELLLLQAGKSVRRLRRAERRFARVAQIAVALALFAAVAGAGAWIERQRADDEQRRRAGAEAERDALIRRTAYANAIGNIQHAVRNGEFGRARQMLRELTPKAGGTDLRGFEWNVLWGQAQGDPAEVWREAGAAILRLALAPDGSWLAALTSEQQVLLFDTLTGTQTGTVTEIKRLGGFSADGRWLLGIDSKGELQSWHTVDWQPRHPARRGAMPYTLGTLGGAKIAGLTNGTPARLVVWDADSRQDFFSAEIDTASESLSWEFFRGAVSAEHGQALIAWVRGRRGMDSRVSLVDLRPGGSTKHAMLDRRVDVVGFDAAGPWIVRAESKNLCRPDASGAWVESSEPIPADTQRIAVHGDARVATDREQLYWLDPSGRVLRTARGHQGIIGDAIWDPNGHRVFSATHAGELRVWRGESAPLEMSLRRIWNSRGAATRLVFSADSKTLAVPADGESVELLDAQTLNTVVRVPSMRYPVWLGANDILGVAADGDGAIRARRDGSGATRELGRAVDVLQLWSGVDGSSLCANDTLGRLWLREAMGSIPRTVMASGYESRFSQVVDAKAGRLWHAGSDNQLRCLELATARELWVVALPALTPGLALSPDESLLAVPLENGRVQLHDAASGALVRTINAGGSTPQHALFSPDGARLFVAGSKGDIACHETAAWLQLGLFQLPATEAWHGVAMSPDGAILAAVTKTGALHLLRARADR